MEAAWLNALWPDAVDKQARLTGQELLEAVANAERERAAAPDEVPLGEWVALRVRPDCNAPLISQALLANSDEAKDVLQVCNVPTLLQVHVFDQIMPLT